MKIFQLSFLFVFLFLSTSFTTSKKNKQPEFEIKKFDKNLCKVKDNLYAYAFETSNGDYTLFINDLKSLGKDWSSQLPDSSFWNTAFPRSRCEPYVGHYFSHPTFRKYPVLNVTYEQANAYCSWLTSKYNGMKKREFQKVQFRLPTIEEWEYAASGGLENSEYPNGGIYLRRNDGLFMYNFQRVGNRNITVDEETGELIIVDSKLRLTGYSEGNYLSVVTTTVDSYWPNGYGLHNCSGNVAEMVSEKGIAKGGSFMDPGYDIRIKSVKKYKEPSPTIGFRVFMEVIEE